MQLSVCKGVSVHMLSVEMCDIRIDLEMERDECLAKLQNVTSGCSGEWDFACWPSASVGQLVTIPCPKYFTHVSDREVFANIFGTVLSC
ncbi:hypothetical protein QTP86_007037 [Hemibagrus guttatus]|nr:hypothetical protein QTP86_007037 [Hemibagrus guttatus]